MDAKEIAGLGSELMDFLGGFDECFGRSEPREHLRTYVSGQLSDLPRKSVEPMALQFAKGNVIPMQRFLTRGCWDAVDVQREVQTIAAERLAPSAARCSRALGCMTFCAALSYC